MGTGLMRLVLFGAGVTLAPAGVRAGLSLTLAAEGRSDYVIVVSRDAIAPEKEAARELSHYLGRITSAEFAVTGEREAPADKRWIMVGATRSVTELLPEINWPALGPEGIVIQTRGDRILIAGGRPRGTIYAVYTFLEDFAGCRWWTSTEASIPPKSVLTIREPDISYVPAFGVRGPGYPDVRDNPGFAVKLKCNAHTDCRSGVCFNSICQAATCADKTQNGAETDVDCGGGICPACADKLKCKAHTDCTSGVCLNNLCQAATCTDKTHNGAETDVDCGGGTCPKCAAKLKCKVPADCITGVCSAGLCVAANCTDKVKNGSETDIDCGGGTCAKCADKLKCKAHTDCTSGVCTNNICQAPTCTDKVLNGSETDVDCGGPTCSACADKKKCKAKTDCLSGVCTGGICQAATCTDKVLNGSETDVDCGGPTCTACADKKKCKAKTDCLSGVCASGVCKAATCSDKVKNGKETDVDCGGGTCSKCVYGKKCQQASDCTTNSCGSGKTCACTHITDCSKGYNCVTGGCVAARSSCASQKSAYSASKDGVYWIKPAAGLTRAYCDMTQKTDLCRETQMTRTGKMRDGSGLPYKMVSKLNWSGRYCEVWAVRHSSNNYPFDTLRKVKGQTLNTCQGMGFKTNHTIKSCKFGSSYKSNCGFPIGTNYYRYGNACSGCTKYNGQYKTYKLQGYMSSASVISTYNGSTRSRCKIE